MILIITGPPAAGKSTVGPIIAGQLERCAVIDVDLVRAMIVQPHVSPWLSEEGLSQLRLGAENASALARNFVNAGFDVVILDVLTDETAQTYRQKLRNVEHMIVLLIPSVEESLRRNQERGQFLTDDEVRILYDWEAMLLEIDVRIDNTYMPVEKLAKQLSLLFNEQR